MPEATPVMPPPSITRAIVLVSDPSFPVDLPPAVRWAFAVLLRRVQVGDGSAEFWVKRVNFAELFDRCPKTITNWLNALEDAGLIQKDQQRTSWGEYRCLSLRLTPRAVSALMLDQPIRREKEVSLAYKYQVKQSKRDSHCEPVDNLSMSNTGRTDQRSVNHGSHALPEDVSPLLSCGLSRPMIFKLMRECRGLPFRLGDFVRAFREPILKSKHPYAYIKSLIAKGLDPSERQKRQFDVIAHQVKTSAEDSLLSVGWKRIQGKSIRIGDKVIKASNKGCPLMIHADEPGWPFLRVLAGPALLDFVKKIGRGDLVFAPA